MKNKLLNLTLGLFIFLSINREFSLFHFDLRFLLMPLSLGALLLTLYEKSWKATLRSLSLDSPGVWLALYFLAAFVSNVAWLWNGLPLRFGALVNLVLVFALNAVTTLLIVLNSEEIRIKLISKMLVISVAVLGVSQLVAYFGIPLDPLLSDASVRVSQAGGEHFNLFGQHFRVSGFAEDPNYACLFNVIALIALAMDGQFSKYSKFSIALLSLFGVAVSWSRTIVFGSVGVLLVFLVAKKLNRSLRAITGGLLIAAVAASLLAPSIALFADPDFLQTVLTRFDLWGRAQELFLRSPILGNGLTSFRSFNMLEVPVWYVHCHSTFWSVLSESGLIGFVFLLGAICCAIKVAASSLYLFVVSIFIAFCVNFDATYLQITVVLLALLPVGLAARGNVKPCEDGKICDEKKTSVLFFINSLTGGGAERVGFEMIGALAKTCSVKVITVYSDKNDYGHLPEGCDLFSLEIPRDSSSAYKLRVMLSKLDAANAFIGDEQQYSLISAHLQMSHIFALLTKVGNKTLYVMHGAQWPTDPGRSIGRRLVLSMLYRGKRMVCVSQGIMDELVSYYGFNPDLCSVINNPFDLTRVKEKSLLPVEGIPSTPFFLCVGRLNKIKRFDRALDAFAQGGFAEKYLLVVLGKGEELDNLVAKAKDLEISHRVIFAGFSDNPFAWMKRSSICLCTSDSEAFPMGLVEALVCEARVVSSDCDYGPREILTGDLSRYLVSPIDDISQYVAVTKDALDEYPKLDESFFSGFSMPVILDKYFSEWSGCFE